MSISERQHEMVTKIYELLGEATMFGECNCKLIKPKYTSFLQVAVENCVSKAKIKPEILVHHLFANEEARLFNLWWLSVVVFQSLVKLGAKPNMRMAFLAANWGADDFLFELLSPGKLDVTETTTIGSLVNDNI
eukprot:Awhi_evm3s6273